MKLITKNTTKALALSFALLIPFTAMARPTTSQECTFNTVPQCNQPIDCPENPEIIPPTEQPDIEKPEITPPTVPDVEKPEVIPPIVDANSNFEQQVLQLVNKERTSRGLSTLKMDPQVQKVARLKSQDMQQKNYFDHTSPTYGTPFQMLKQFGIQYTSAGENIAMGYSSPKAVVEGWMNSPGHRENILKPGYTHMGVGYHKQGNYWTQMFISK